MPHGLRASRHMYIYSVPAVCLRFLIRARGIALLVPVSLLVPVPKLAIAGGSASGPRSVPISIYPSPPKGTSLSPLALFRLAYQRDPNPYFLARIITAATLLLLSTIGSFHSASTRGQATKNEGWQGQKNKRRGKEN
ncbi:hypothetical protein TgHK011_000775 [Trichoderma gracile]|nr:hypothetical protein TgHK011_000775 [Trichoderma gracile]